MEENNIIDVNFEGQQNPEGTQPQQEPQQDPKQATPAEAPDPKLQLCMPPHPRTAAIQRLVDDFELMAPTQQKQLLADIEEYYASLFFAAGSRTDAPEVPDSFKALDAKLRGFLDTCIPVAWKKYHFTKGWNALTPEQKEQIAEERKREREEREAALYYAHLPAEGAEFDGKHVPLEGLKMMVDKGWLAPNPEAKTIEVKPSIVTDKPLTGLL